ncbi:DJ-1/PfpI family protein [Brevundimonas sp. 2R-24]|uniref:DJ-1/PfpI family protein n=1 Tax=Peiella sedimenti TaxID=3061083 RepID=A0ABT8SI13_9CAUL|nr:DJ-1/PfpI family protein [Caulobacteraceae bacterium XZ-24]
MTKIKTTRRALMAGATLTATVGASALCAGLTAAHAKQLDPLPRPQGPIRVAFLLDEQATMIDFAGPWEVFQDVFADHRNPSFELQVVAPTAEPIRVTGGMIITPTYSLDTAPQPHVVVIPAQAGGVRPGPTTDVKVAWLRQVYDQAHVIMPVCTGAFLMARTGLLDGRSVTTHHNFYDRFTEQFPQVNLLRGRRFVDSGNLVSAGGLTSGIDSALHVVARYFGEDMAAAVAEYMEHDSAGWRTGVRA